jgi:hypothetical protein
MLIALPAEPPPNAENLAPKRESEKTDKVDPSLVYDLTLIAEPRFK